MTDKSTASVIDWQVYLATIIDVVIVTTITIKESTMPKTLSAKAVREQTGPMEDLTQGDGFVTVPAAARFLRLAKAKIYM